MLNSVLFNVDGKPVDVFDLLIIGYCLASNDQVVGVDFLEEDSFGVFYYFYDADDDAFYFACCENCKDTEETRKTAVFKYCDSLTNLYHSLPVGLVGMLNGDDHYASIRSRHFFNIDI